jgi:Ca2+-binding RTX toxin-like protein
MSDAAPTSMAPSAPGHPPAQQAQARPGDPPQVDIAQSSPGPDGPVGTINQVVGSAIVTRADGTVVVVVSPGVQINRGDIINTPPGASIEIGFDNSAQFFLGENGRALVEAVGAQTGGTSSSLLFVLQGAFGVEHRSGSFSGDPAMVVRTPVATVHLQNGRLAGRAAPEAVDNVFTLLRGGDGLLGFARVVTAGGAILLQNELASAQVLSLFREPTPLPRPDLGDFLGQFGPGVAGWSQVPEFAPAAGPNADPAPVQPPASGPEPAPGSSESGPAGAPGLSDGGGQSGPGLDPHFVTLPEQPDAPPSIPVDAGANNPRDPGPVDGGPAPPDPVVRTDFDGGSREVFGTAGIDTLRVSANPVAPSNIEITNVGGKVQIRNVDTGVVITASAFEELQIDLGSASDSITIGSLAGTDIADNTIVIDAGGGDDVIDAEFAGKRIVVDGGDGNDTLTGGSSNDTLIGGDGNDILDGKGGADEMTGGAGDDIFFVDNAGDQVVESANAGTDTVNSTIGYTLAANVENLVLTAGAGSIDGTGNALANAITGNEGDNLLDGGGGVDTLTGGLGNDTYRVDETADVVVEAVGEGTDTVESTAASYTLSANVENLTLTGTADIDGTGNAAANVITGNAGNNTLDGGGGVDTLTGGLGNDTYRVDETADIVVEAVGEGTDTVESTAASYTLSANVENLTLIGAGDIDGTGNALANAITGNEGDNLLDGGAGDDVIDGGAGNDTVTYASVTGAGVTVDLSNISGGSNAQGGGGSSAGNDTLSNIENVIGSAFADTITGDGNANVLSGLGGNDVIDGDAGDDIVDGGTGDDIINGGTGNDTVTYANVTGGGVTVDLSNISGGSNAQGGGGSSAGNDTLSNVENVIGSAFSDTITGDGNANVLSGLGGNDVIDGGAGNDVIDGGAGNDTVTYANVTGAGVTVDLSDISGGSNAQGKAGSNAGNDTLSNIENIIGSAFFDTLTGNGSANVIDGGAGNDVLGGGGGADTLTGGSGNDAIDGGADNDMIDGGAGDDVIDGGAGNDTVTYAGVTGAGVTVDLSDISGGTNAQGDVDSDAGDDTLSNVENIIGSAFSDTIAGDGNANVLSGLGGNDVIDGGGGADSLSGGGGDDTINGGDGNDLIDGGSGNDIIDGGAGNDTVTYAGVTGAGVTVDLSDISGSPNAAGDASSSAGNDTLSNVENIVGSAFSDTITGDGNANVLSGLGGNDVIDGGGGADTLTGGGGNDVLTGGADADTFVFGTGFGNDTITDFVTGTDKIDLSALGTLTFDTIIANTTDSGSGAVIALTDGTIILTGVDRTDLSTGDFSGLTAATGGNDTISGGANDDTIAGLGGDDVLSGGAGDDTLAGGDGADTLSGGDGNDQFYYAAPTEGGDSVTDFASGSDTFVFLRSAFDNIATVDGSNFATIGTAYDGTNGGLGGVASFVYSTFDNTLTYDADGNGAGNGFTIAQITGGDPVTAASVTMVDSAPV